MASPYLGNLPLSSRRPDLNQRPPLRRALREVAGGRAAALRPRQTEPAPGTACRRAAGTSRTTPGRACVRRGTRAPRAPPDRARLPRPRPERPRSRDNGDIFQPGAEMLLAKTPISWASVGVVRYRARTNPQPIRNQTGCDTSEVLYQLSYVGVRPANRHFLPPRHWQFYGYRPTYRPTRSRGRVHKRAGGPTLNPSARRTMLATSSDMASTLAVR